MAVWNRLNEFVPSKDEVREYEKDGSQGKEAASLKHSADKHKTYKYRVYADSYAQNPCRNKRYYPEEYHAEKDYGAEYHHSEISLGFSCELAVRFDSFEISVDEIDDEPYMSQGEESHLCQEVAAGTEVVSQCAEEQGEAHLPRTKPQ